MTSTFRIDRDVDVYSRPDSFAKRDPFFEPHDLFEKLICRLEKKQLKQLNYVEKG